MRPSLATRLVVLACAVAAPGGCLPDAFESADAPLPAYCSARVEGLGQVDVESQYLPRVVQCENGAADFEALKAQAVAARSYLYYRLRLVGYIRDGQMDQVYSCGRTPTRQQVEAVRATSGLVLAHGGSTLATFYVAGAEPGGPDCMGDGPGTANTEHYVTYNEGRRGEDVQPTALGDTSSPDNRGCMSQNGADCLAEQGRSYEDILRFYYGGDATLMRAVGTCVDAAAADPQTQAGDAVDEGAAGRGDAADQGGAAGQDDAAGQGGAGQEQGPEPPPGCACDDSTACTPGCACDPDCSACGCDTSSSCDRDAWGDRCACDVACTLEDGPFNADCGCDVDVQCDLGADGEECVCDPDCNRCDCDVDLDCNTDARGCDCGCDVDCGWTFTFNGRCGCDTDFECNTDALSCGCGCDPDC